MQSIFLWAASVAALVTFIVHTFMGGVAVARPLLADKSLPQASKWLNYYCWHVTTIVILAMCVSFAYAAMQPVVNSLAVVMATLSLCLSALSVWVAMKGGINPLKFPSTTLFAVTGALALAGLFV